MELSSKPEVSSLFVQNCSMYKSYSTKSEIEKKVEEDQAPFAIISDMSKLNDKLQTPTTVPQSKNVGNAEYSNPNISCYEEYCKLYFANIILTNQLKVLLNEKSLLLKKLQKVEVELTSNQNLPDKIIIVLYHQLFIILMID